MRSQRERIAVDGERGAGSATIAAVDARARRTRARRGDGRRHDGGDARTRARRRHRRRVDAPRSSASREGATRPPILDRSSRVARVQGHRSKSRAGFGSRSARRGSMATSMRSSCWRTRACRRGWKWCWRDSSKLPSNWSKPRCRRTPICSRYRASAGAHMTIARETLALLKQRGASDVRLVMGGIIPEEDRAADCSTSACRRCSRRRIPTSAPMIERDGDRDGEERKAADVTGADRGVKMREWRGALTRLISAAILAAGMLSDGASAVASAAEPRHGCAATSRCSRRAGR